jgi:hypothetical protein
MLQFVGCIVVTDVSNVRNSFILMVKQSKSTVLALLDHEGGSIMILLISSKLLPIDRAYYLRRPEILYGYYTFNGKAYSPAAWPHLYGLQIRLTNGCFQRHFVMYGGVTTCPGSSRLRRTDQYIYN